MAEHPPLIAVAHGSRDPRSPATVAALLDVLRAAAPGLDVRSAFLGLSPPLLPEVLASVRADGHRHAVVVPLLLGSAYHARVDIPGAVRDAARRHPRLAVTVAGVLGPDPRLETVALRRLAEAGVNRDDPHIGVVLAATGSSHPAANAEVSRLAGRWAAATRWAAAAFAAAAEPAVPTAVAGLRAAGAGRIALSSWFLAPGLLFDRVAEQAGDGVVIAAPLGAAPEVAAVVLDRYAAAASVSAWSCRGTTTHSPELVRAP